MLTDVSEVRAASIIALMVAARTSETSVDIQLRTRQVHLRRFWALMFLFALSFLLKCFVMGPFNLHILKFLSCMNQALTITISHPNIWSKTGSGVSIKVITSEN
jgi:hypothetical protein